MLGRVLPSVALAAMALLVSRAARAQAEPPPSQDGWSADAFVPAERGSRWFAAESLDLRGHGRMALGAVATYSHRLVVARDSDGTALGPVVENQARLHTGASFVFADRLRLGFDVPLQIVNDGQTVVVRGVTYRHAYDQAMVGDVRLSADVRIFGRFREGFTGAIGGQLLVPAGAPRSFTGDGEPHVRTRVMFAYDRGSVTLAASGGVHVRGREENWAGGRIGSELFTVLAGGVLLANGRIVVGPELQATTVVSGGEGFQSRTTPIEAIFGTRWEVLPFIRVGAGLGAGLTRAYGAPAVRGLLSLEWTPEDPPAPPPPEPEKKDEGPDRDGDGVPDALDACGFVPGEASPFAERNGCPPPLPAAPPTTSPSEPAVGPPSEPPPGAPAPPPPPASEETPR